MKPADSAAIAVIRLHLWVERHGDTLFGLGRLHLLDLIESTGSLKKAAETLGMSYRAAWGKIKKSEEALGVCLLEKTGGNRTGFRLTPAGQQLAEAFRTWFTEVERHALERARILFPFTPAAFTGPPTPIPAPPFGPGTGPAD